MSGKIEINSISNANIYLNNGSMLGKAEEIKCPDVSAIMQERKALGMIGKIELPVGFDKLEGEIKWNSFYADVAKIAANPFGIVPLQCRSSVARFNSSQGRYDEIPLVTFMTVLFNKNPLGTYKQHESPDFTSSFSCTYIKQVLDGEDILELDYMANIFKVNGVDMLADYRSNIGG